MDKPFYEFGKNDTPYDSGRSFLFCLLWYFVSVIVFESSFFPVYSIKSRILRWFGAKIGEGLIIKPNVRIKTPWRLTIGDHCWIGQDAWIDNMGQVTIGNSVCISQSVFVCTGSHDYQSHKMDLLIKPIVIHDSVWVAARASVLQGVTIQSNTIVTAGSIVHRSHEGNVVLGGNPAKVIRRLAVNEGRMSIVAED